MFLLKLPFLQVKHSIYSEDRVLVEMESWKHSNSVIMLIRVVVLQIVFSNLWVLFVIHPPIYVTFHLSVMESMISVLHQVLLKIVTVLSLFTVQIALMQDVIYLPIVIPVEPMLLSVDGVVPLKHVYKPIFPEFLVQIIIFKHYLAYALPFVRMEELVNVVHVHVKHLILVLIVVKSSIVQVRQFLQMEQEKFPMFVIFVVEMELPV